MKRRRRGLQFYHKKKVVSASAVREVFGWIASVVFAVVLAFAVVWCVGVRTSVIGVSMEPGLTNGQAILVNRVAYGILDPKAGDVVVFLPNGNENSHLYVKRVVAVPGQTVLIENGVLYVDGEPVGADTYDLIASGGIAENGLTLEKDEYFVLGDNCNNSEDSRSANIGPVSKSTIVGRAWFHFSGEKDGWGLVE